MYHVYVKADDRNRITAVNSSAFLADTTGWTQIDEGVGDKYHHAQGNYFPTPVYENHSIPVYKLVDGQAVERTAGEIAADIAALLPFAPTPIDILQAQIDALTVAILEG